MAIEQAREALRRWGAEGRILELPASSATVELAAKALCCEPAHIAKTLAFHAKEQVLLIVMAGDARVDNKKYKARFGVKAAMLPFDQTEQAVGHAPGGIMPVWQKAGNPGLSGCIPAAVFHRISRLRFSQQRHRPHDPGIGTLCRARGLGGCLQGLGAGGKLISDGPGPG